MDSDDGFCLLISNTFYKRKKCQALSLTKPKSLMKTLMKLLNNSTSNKQGNAPNTSRRPWFFATVAAVSNTDIFSRATSGVVGRQLLIY